MASSLELALDFRTQRFADAAKGLAAVATHLGKGLDQAPQRIRHEIKDFLDSVAEAMEQRHGKGWPGGTSTNTLSKRSGHLIESIRESINVHGEKISTISGSISLPNDRKIHEHGGVIRAKTAKYLTIPLPAALDNRGIPLKKSARDWDKTFVIKSKRGNLLIVQKQGTQLVPLYVLKTSVYIPPRLGMGKTFEAGRGYLVDRIADALLQSLKAA